MITESYLDLLIDRIILATGNMYGDDEVVYQQVEILLHFHRDVRRIHSLFVD